MATIDENKNIFVTDFGTRYDSNKLPGNTVLSIQSELHRGFNFNIGATQYTYIETLLNKWRQLQIFAYSKNEARVQAQIQTPLNLFKEAGLAARIQAFASVSFGVGLSLNMIPQDLKNKAKDSLESDTLFRSLVDIAIDNINFIGGLYGNVAVGAMAYANMVVSGSLQTNDIFKVPGLIYIFDTGMGYTAGGGYRLILETNFINTRRIVDEISEFLSRGIVHRIEMDEKENNLSEEQLAELSFFELFLKISMVMSYEIGDELSRKYIIASDTFTPRALNVIVIEGQRWFLNRLTKFGLIKLETIIRESGISNEKTKVLMKFLDEITEKAIPVMNDWFKLIELAKEISFEFPSDYIKKEWNNILAMIWAAAYLVDKVSINTHDQSELYSYSNILNENSQPPDVIKSWINIQLNQSESTLLTEQNLLQFILGDPVKNFLEQKEEGLRFLNLYRTTFGTLNNNTIQHLFNFQGDIGDKKIILKNFLSEFQSEFNAISASIEPVIRESISIYPEIKMLYERVLNPSIQITIDIVIPQIINNFQGFKKEVLQEAVSSILLSVIGKTMLHVFETVFKNVEHDIERQLNLLANKLNELNIMNNFKKFLEIESQGIEHKLFEPLMFNFEEINIKLFEPLIKESVKLSFENIVPLSNKSREKMFELLNDTVIVIPKNEEQNVQGFINELNKPMYMPTRNEMEKLISFLGINLGNQMFSFSTMMLPKLLQVVEDYMKYILEEWLKKQFLNVLMTVANLVYTPINEEINNKIVNNLKKQVIDKVYRFNTIPDLIPDVKKDLNNKVEEKLGAEVGRVFSPIIKESLGNLKLNMEEMLNILKKHDFNIFQTYFVDTINKQLKEEFSKHKLEMNISFSFKIPGTGGISIPDIHFPIRSNNNTRCSDYDTSYYRASIPISVPTFNVPHNLVFKIIDESESLQKLPFNNYYRQLLSAANPVFIQEEEILKFKHFMGTLKDFHKDLSPPEINDFQPRIFLKSIDYRESQPYINLIIYYPSIAYFDDENISIIINNNSLPINSFNKIDKPQIGNDTLSGGLTIGSRIPISEFRNGVNLIYTEAMDAQGEYQKLLVVFNLM
ncbi:hypothetical protein [Bacillus cereus]|uniref:hypothetical protein n=1 Tax=Bacillus cereus TaxID=1396 RepID=UPI000BF2C1BC|nr:hypothetical protein [Bacillus cereus]PFC90481.1 hypothetical protein CN276_00005 [Bacillus cereus]